MKYTADIKELPEGMVEITGELDWANFAEFEQKAFDRLAAHLEIDGFRKGKVPADVARKSIRDELILADMAELAIQALYPVILTDKKIDAIGRPSLAITKLARDNSLGFTIRTSVVPDIKLPDYKKIAAKFKLDGTKEVTEEEIDKVVEDLRQLRAYGHVHNHGDEHQHTEPLPEVTDEFAKSFGNFETVASMREKIKENIAREHEQDMKDKRRIAIMDAIIAETSFTIPAVVLQSEQERMLAGIEAEVSRAGMSMDDYFKQIDKTREAVLEEFKPEAEKRARFQLLINAIARDAGIMPTDAEVEAEADKLMQAYPGADKARAIAYADLVLTNEKTFELLEQ
jgi:FKBP-type peptidyl-prolyl cis-trans isomerase (trigger factor)